MATKQLGDPSASLLLTSEKAISCKIQFQHFPRFICLYWIYSSGYILPTIIRWVFFCIFDFWGQILQGPNLPGPTPGARFAGDQFATKNYQGPNLPQKITRGPCCRCPICLESILRSIMLNRFFCFFSNKVWNEKKKIFWVYLVDIVGYW